MRLEIHTDDRAPLDELRDVAAMLYAGDPFWSHPSDPTPSLEPVWLAVREGGSIVARACAVRAGNDEALRLGWYECVDDVRAATMLLDGARALARERGASRVIGPINGTTWHRYRLADPSPSPPFFLDVHNKPWYVEQWRSAGATTIERYYSTRIAALGGYEGHEERIARQRERGVTLRRLRPERFDEELATIHALSLEGFRENALYTPIGLEEFRALYRPIEPIVRPEHVLIAESADGDAVGFVFAVDNLHERERRSLVMKSAAVLPSYAGRGLGHLLLESVHVAAAAAGYDEIIHALIHSDNRSGAILADRAEVHRTYRLFALDAREVAP